jgi:hypothetical protein
MGLSWWHYSMGLGIPSIGVGGAAFCFTKRGKWDPRFDSASTDLANFLAYDNDVSKASI